MPAHALILTLLQGSLLDDEQLVDVLQSSKATAEDIKKQLQISEQTSAKIDLARQAFSSFSLRASTLFFVLKVCHRYLSPLLVLILH